MPHPKDTPTRRVFEYLRAGGHRTGQELRVGDVVASAPDVVWALGELRTSKPEFHAALIWHAQPKRMKRTLRSIGIEAGVTPQAIRHRIIAGCQLLVDFLRGDFQTHFKNHV